MLGAHIGVHGVSNSRVFEYVWAFMDLNSISGFSCPKTTLTSTLQETEIKN